MFHVEASLVLEGDGAECGCGCGQAGAGGCDDTINHVPLVPGQMGRGEQASQVTVKGVWPESSLTGPPPPSWSSS